MIRLTAYGLTGIVASGVGFIAGLYLTFPSEAAITYLNFQIDKASNHEYSIAADTLGPWWATGLMFENMTVYTVKRARHVRDQPQTYDRAPFVHFDALGVRLAPFSFLTGKQGYSFAADVLNGSIDGVYAFSTDLIDLSFDIDGLDLSKLGAAGPEATFNLLGALVGEADLHLNLKEIKQSSGTMALSINGFAIGPGSKMAGFDLPETKFTTARLSFDVHDGKMSVTDGSFEGDIITGTITGDVTLNKKLGRSRSKLDLGFTLPDDYQKLADLSPTLKRSKDEEGRYHCSIGGTISAPAFRCGKGPAPRVRETTGMRASDSPLVGSGPDETELSDEERRTRREERIKERRERLKKRREEQGLTPLGTPDRPSVPFDPAEDGPPGIDQRFPDPEEMPDELPPDLPPEILEQPPEEP